MTKLILVRHGETEWDRQKRVQGALDIPLNACGKEQAINVADALSKLKIDDIYSSPVSCSLTTAGEIAKHHELKVKQVQQLREPDQGMWQGLLERDVKKRYRRQYSVWKSEPVLCKPPCGEFMREAYDRAVSAFHKIVDKHKGENICLVSGGVIGSIIKSYLKNNDLKDACRSASKENQWEVFDI